MPIFVAPGQALYNPAFLGDLPTPPAHFRRIESLKLENPLAQFGITFPDDRSGETPALGAAHEFKFKVADLKPENFDTQIKDLLRGELGEFHPFFKKGLEAAQARSYKFILFDPADSSVPKEIVAAMVGAKAVTDVKGARVYIGKPTGENDLVSSLVYELCHVASNLQLNTYSPSDPKVTQLEVALDIMKQSLLADQKGDKTPTTEERNFYQAITQETIGWVAEQTMSKLIADPSFVPSLEMVSGMTYQMPNFENYMSKGICRAMFGDDAYREILKGANKAPDAKPEAVAFARRMIAFLDSSETEKKAFEFLKTWGFKTKE